MRIELPQVGESVTEGDIGRWLKQVGDRVEKYEPLVEVITDKVNMEVPSPVSGVLTSILVEEGETVPMGAAIAEIKVEGEEPAAVQAVSPGPSSAPGVDVLDRIGTLAKDVAPVGPTGSGGVLSTATEDEAPQVQRRRYSPAVQRLAGEHGIDPSLVSGTGIGGRVTLKDIRSSISGREAASPESVGVVAPTEGPQQPSAVEASPDSEVVQRPLTPIRRMIAERMVESASQIPEAWTVVEVDVTGLVQRRESLKADFQRREGANLTYLPFVVHAVARSLREHLLLNSSWTGDSISVNQRINIGIAVAAPEGLMVPVIHDADTLSIAILARVMHGLSSKAQQGKLDLSDVRGGTFTVNNTGVLGSVVSKPIINFPQAAILTTEAVARRPVVIGEGIAIRSMMNICMTFDHRILDGAEVGSFLGAVKRRLESVGPGTEIY